MTSGHSSALSQTRPSKSGTQDKGTDTGTKRVRVFGMCALSRHSSEQLTDAQTRGIRPRLDVLATVHQTKMDALRPIGARHKVRFCASYPDVSQVVGVELTAFAVRGKSFAMMIALVAAAVDAL